MSFADEKFKSLAQTILDSPYADTAMEVRPKWEDGTPAHTRKTFGWSCTYDLQKEFPLLTLRPVGVKSCVDEMLWIYQRHSNNIHDLKPHIWDEWADEEGSIGRAYGYQIAQLHRHHRWKEDPKEKAELQQYPSAQIDEDGGWVLMNQMDAVLWDLRHTPASRRIITNMYNHQDSFAMGLQPCVFMVNYSTTGDLLNATVYQRSLDTFVAQAWNVAQYAALLMMVAQATGFKPGKMLHVVTDAHIYDRHESLVREMLTREGLPAPKVTLNPDKKDFYSFTPEDFVVEGYEHHPQFVNIPVAV